jgi:hypothetical protein
MVDSERVELLDDLFGRRVLLDLAARVEANHVGRADGRVDLEALLESFGEGGLHLGDGHLDGKLDLLPDVVLVVGLEREEETREFNEGVQGRRTDCKEERTEIMAGTFSVSVSQPSSIALKSIVHFRIGSSVISTVVSSICSIRPETINFSSLARVIVP